MADPVDFPVNPTVNQLYTAPSGVTYAWNGLAWDIGFFDSSTQGLETVGDLLSQIRTLLMDKDTSSGEYRYSTDSLILNINQGMLEMLRIRPDIFIESNFQAPQYVVSNLSQLLGIEPQFVPSLVYYAVGMAQLRDDEETQDSRAGAFLAKFTSTLVAVA